MAFAKLTNCWKLLCDWSTSRVMKKDSESDHGGHPPASDETNSHARKELKPPAVYTLGPAGGTGGRAKIMVAEAATRIVKVMVRRGEAIDAIRVVYRRGDGAEDETTDWWGGKGGQFSEFTMDDDEHLTSLNGHYGNWDRGMVIRSLTFVSNKRTYGPYGREVGIPFYLNAQGGKIVGFFGHTGDFVDAIGIRTTAALF